MKKITIAIDGYSSCGKSTMAKQLARQLGYVYVDTGAQYRAVTLYALRNGYFDGMAVKTDELKADIEGGKVNVSFVVDAESGKPLTVLNGEVVESEIRLMEVSNHVSPIAAVGFVREFLVRQQQKMGEKKGVVMDGRDIGTTVFPNAELKVFVTASADVRAKRRYDELVSKGEKDVDLAEIKMNVEQRDYIDTHREVSPLRKADDAVVLDNSYMTIDEQNEWLMNQVKKAIV